MYHIYSLIKQLVNDSVIFLKRKLTGCIKYYLTQCLHAIDMGAIGRFVFMLYFL